MLQFIFLISLAIIAGIAAALQAHLMGLLDRGLGTLESVFITYFGGGLLIFLVMVAARGGNLQAWRQVPWYACSAGVFGLIIVATVSYVVPRLGLVTSFTVIVASQFLLGAVMDHFGLLGAVPRPLDAAKLVGIAILLLGVWLIVRK